MRLNIKPGLRRVWRESGSLQIGLSRTRGTVIGGLEPTDVRLLEQLGRGEGMTWDEGPEPSEGPGRAAELLDLLGAAGVLATSSGGPPEGLEPHLAERAEADRQVWSVVHGGPDDGWPVMAARATGRVLVAGAGRVAHLLAGTLAEAGVGTVLTAPGPAGHPHETGEPLDVVVLVEHAVADAEAAGRLLSADVPHLSVVVREDDVVVGPLVRPGRGPCLRCLDLHRGERDPAWPSILAQLVDAGGPVPGAGPEAAGGRASTGPEETAVSRLAAGLAALQVLVLLDGVEEPAAAGATLEIELPHGLVAHRTWPTHPACGCHWPLGQASERGAVRTGRMEW